MKENKGKRQGGENVIPEEADPKSGHTTPLKPIRAPPRIKGEKPSQKRQEYTHTCIHEPPPLGKEARPHGCNNRAAPKTR